MQDSAPPVRVVVLAELDSGDPVVEPLGHRAGCVGVDADLRSLVRHGADR